MASSGKSPFTLCIVLGLILIILGTSAYVLSDFASITALIPSFFGVLIAFLGVIGRQTERDRPAVYGIGILAALGVLGSTRGIPDIIALLTGEPVESVIAAVSQGAMIAICLVLLAIVGMYVLDTR
ncbi:hypothetical protein ACFFQF_30270 [Haladaptatus pallidirubidus]|uniref:Uncharacterized protein n=1 Tax=Haladaptatus pallidirubidus TaxID=1008152 RepID=A0AAV3UI48_9EURY|nr:hypothetical protein [Haladaptatus pallidirubidus]